MRLPPPNTQLVYRVVLTPGTDEHEIVFSTFEDADQWARDRLYARYGDDVPVEEGRDYFINWYRVVPEQEASPGLPGGGQESLEERGLSTALVLWNVAPKE